MGKKINSAPKTTKKLSKPKKLKWNLGRNIAVVTKTLENSKMELKKTPEYKAAMVKLQKYYGLTRTQVWILCMALDLYIEYDDPISVGRLSSYLECSSMELVSWQKQFELLQNKNFLEPGRNDNQYKPALRVLNALFDNTELSEPAEKKKYDDNQFLRDFSFIYESRLEKGISDYEVSWSLFELENKHKNIPIVKTLMSAFPEVDHYRFFLYDVCSDVVKGGISALKRTVSDLYDDPDRTRVCQLFLNETHPLLKQGILEFRQKENLDEATITLSDKGKKLMLGDRAFMYMDNVDQKYLINCDKIKEQKLFYSEEVQKQIDTIHKALEDKKFKEIQERLTEKGMHSGFAMIFYGGPGTGKTETAMQLARMTGRDIVHVDISDSKSAWFGESEKKIKAIFQSYKNLCNIKKTNNEKLPILLFNEADAIISKRKDVESGNVAQTENAMQNILLEEMENLEGIMIATTNLSINIDPAFERRFLFKVQFKNPTLEAKEKIWKLKLNWLTQKQAQHFAESYDFSGGQIDNIARKAAMTEIITGKNPSVEELESYCKTEKLVKEDEEKHIGFFK